MISALAPPRRPAGAGFPPPVGILSRRGPAPHPPRTPSGSAAADGRAVTPPVGAPPGPTAGGRVLASGPDGSRWLVAGPDGDRVVWMLAAEVSGRARRRVLDELRALVAIPPGVGLAPVLDVGTTAAGQPWMARAGGGGTVLGLLGSGPRPRALVADLVAGVATALDHLHHHHGPHGGVRPVAVALDADGDSSRPALAEPVPASVAGALLVLDGCTPPERLEGAAPAPAGDVYGLAATAALLLTGRPPWRGARGEGPAEVLLALLADPAPGLVGADLDDDLARVLTAALAIDPGARPSLAEVVVALRSVPAHPAPLPSSPDDERPTVVPGVPVRPLPAAPADTGGGPAAVPLEARPLGSRYLLHDRLGRGATGEVWRATRREGGGEVAVKVLRPELADDHDLVARFVQERSTLVGLAHPGLVSVHDLVVEGSTLAIVMDLVDGPDLRRYLRGAGSPPPATACDLVAQLADGLAAVHEAGVVHRDLKPENILLLRDPRGGDALVARLTDFGIARSPAGPVLTRLDQLVGTPEYLAPELVEGGRATPAADIYALGVVAYELVCGRRPFVGEYPAAVLRGHLDDRPPRPVGVDDRLWALLADCLAKGPVSRPAAVEVSRRARAVGVALAGAAPLAGFVVSEEAPVGPSAPVDRSRSTEGGQRFDDRPAAATGRRSDDDDDHDDDRLLTVGGRRLPPAPPTEAAPARSRTPLVLGIAGLVVASALIGVGMALLTGDERPSGPPASAPPLLTAVLLQTEVTPGGEPGTVRVEWADATDLPGFDGYQIQRVGAGEVAGDVVGRVAAGSTGRTLRGLPEGEFVCVVVSALVDTEAAADADLGQDDLTLANARGCAVPGLPP